MGALAQCKLLTDNGHVRGTEQSRFALLASASHFTGDGAFEHRPAQEGAEEHGRLAVAQRSRVCSPEHGIRGRRIREGWGYGGRQGHRQGRRHERGHAAAQLGLSLFCCWSSGAEDETRAVRADGLQPGASQTRQPSRRREDGEQHAFWSVPGLQEQEHGEQHQQQHEQHRLVLASPGRGAIAP